MYCNFINIYNIKEKIKIMNPGEYETVTSIIRQKFIMGIGLQKNSTNELTFEFLHYWKDAVNEDLQELVCKSLELDSDHKVEILSNETLKREEEPNILCTCKLTRLDNGFIVNDVMIVVNTIESFSQLILHDTIRRLVTKDPHGNIAISMLTGLPYYIKFNVNEKLMDELINLIKPHYERVNKNICSISNNSYKLVMEEKSNDLIISLVYAK